MSSIRSRSSVFLAPLTFVLIHVCSEHIPIDDPPPESGPLVGSWARVVLIAPASSARVRFALDTTGTGLLPVDVYRIFCDSTILSYGLDAGQCEVSNEQYALDSDASFIVDGSDSCRFWFHGDTLVVRRPLRLVPPQPTTYYVPFNGSLPPTSWPVCP